MWPILGMPETFGVSKNASLPNLTYIAFLLMKDKQFAISFLLVQFRTGENSLASIDM